MLKRRAGIQATIAADRPVLYCQKSSRVVSGRGRFLQLRRHRTAGSRLFRFGGHPVLILYEQPTASLLSFAGQTVSCFVLHLQLYDHTTTAMHKLSAAALMVLLVRHRLNRGTNDFLSPDHPQVAESPAAAQALGGIPRLLTSYRDTADQPSFQIGGARRLLNAGSSIDNSGTNAPDGV